MIKKTGIKKINTIRYTEMINIGLSMEKAELLGYLVLPDKIKHCLHCGAKSYGNDFCDNSCALDYSEE